MASRTEPTPVPFRVAIERAIAVCLKHGVATSKGHCLSLLKAKTEDNRALKYFYSVAVRAGRSGYGLMIVDVGDFEQRVLQAHKLCPSKRNNWMPVVTEDNINPPSEG